MAFDGIVTKSVVDELNKKIVGGRVNQVYQPETDEIYINIYNKGENYKLLLSASSNNPRFHLTDVDKKNPLEPPMFCMVLRKYLNGSTINSIEQYDMDRVVFFNISSRDELGFDSEKVLTIEIMGRHSNIIIFDKESKVILDSIKRVSMDMSRVRQIYPGIKYDLPPKQDKVNPLNLDKKEFLNLLNNTNENTEIYKFLYQNYLGLSPLISHEIIYRAEFKPNLKCKDLNNDNIDKLYDSFYALIEDIKNKNYFPNLIIKNNRFKAFHCMELNKFNNCESKEFENVSNLLDYYFYNRDKFTRFNQKFQSLRKIVLNNLDRNKNKLNKQNREFGKSKNRDICKIYGDLISANIHRMDRGIKSIEVENFYDENMELIEIPLSKKKTPAENAQYYYKKYSKLKNANKLLKKQIPNTKNEIKYLESILVSIDNSTNIDELKEIEEELIEEKYIKVSKNKKRKKNKVSEPYKFISKDGFTILVGKNNRQNDKVTFRLSSRNDIWLHVQNMPGSHVIIKNNGQNVPKTTLIEAALLAGYYSKGRNSNNLPIDYTERKHVRKIPGAKAGMVTYDNFETIIVDPDKNSILNIKEDK